MDDLGGVATDDVSAQDLSIFAHNDLGKALCFADCDGLTDGGPGETLDTYLWILLAGGGLCQADKCDLGEGIDGVGDDIVVHGGFVSCGVVGCDLAFG